MFKIVNEYGTTVLLKFGSNIEQAIYQNKQSAYAALSRVNKGKLFASDTFSVRAV